MAQFLIGEQYFQFFKYIHLIKNELADLCNTWITLSDNPASKGILYLPTILSFTD